MYYFLSFSLLLTCPRCSSRQIIYILTYPIISTCIPLFLFICIPTLQTIIFKDIIFFLTDNPHFLYVRYIYMIISFFSSVLPVFVCRVFFNILPLSILYILFIFFFMIPYLSSLQLQTIHCFSYYTFY